jgi:hypothetical protein
VNKKAAGRREERDKVYHAPPIKQSAIGVSPRAIAAER